MTRPLTKTAKDGTRYQRPAAVDAQIDEVLRLPLERLIDRARINDPSNPHHLSSECLVHLIREGFRQWRRSRDERLMNPVLRILLRRCQRVLLGRIRISGGIADAESLRREILDELEDLFVTDGLAEGHDELDIYECTFNRAFRMLYVDALRRAQRQRANEVEIEPQAHEVAGGPDPDEDVFVRISEELRVSPTQESDALREAILKAIETLPPEERAALVLVLLLGYKEESDDPDEETAATRCNCTGRTIRNRKKRALAKLAHLFLEDR
jgi:RNA polymerase sigma factor (sigma-70 family)